jgi:hypothetical protein
MSQHTSYEQACNDFALFSSPLQEHNEDTTMTLNAQLRTQTETSALSRTDILPDIKYLKGFMGARQISALGKAMYKADQKDAAAWLIRTTADKIRNMPEPRDQEGKGNDAIVPLHYFNSSMDFWIIEKDDEDLQDQYRAYGCSNTGYGFEEGYINIKELIDHNVELDLYWEPSTLRLVKEKRNHG